MFCAGSLPHSHGRATESHARCLDGGVPRESRATARLCVQLLRCKAMSWALSPAQATNSAARTCAGEAAALHPCRTGPAPPATTDIARALGCISGWRKLAWHEFRARNGLSRHRRRYTGPTLPSSVAHQPTELRCLDVVSASAPQTGWTTAHVAEQHDHTKPWRNGACGTSQNEDRDDLGARNSERASARNKCDRLSADHHHSASAVLGVARDGLGDNPELLAEVVRGLLVHGQLEGEQPARVRRREDGRPAALLGAQQAARGY